MRTVGITILRVMSFSNSSFQLHPRLAQDCFELGRLGMCRILLLNNAAVPWFILVPETDVVEIPHLPWDQQVEVLQSINTLSGFVEQLPYVEKLNIATIGNIVSQLHIHIIGRHPQDFCWPNPVWGQASDETYSDAAVLSLQQSLEQYLKAK